MEGIEHGLEPACGLSTQWGVVTQTALEAALPASILLSRTKMNTVRCICQMHNTKTQRVTQL